MYANTPCYDISSDGMVSGPNYNGMYGEGGSENMAFFFLNKQPCAFDGFNITVQEFNVDGDANCRAGAKVKVSNCIFCVLLNIISQENLAIVV